MIVYLISTAIALAVLLLGEKLLPNETKEVYKEKSYDWNKVIIYSSIAGLAGGLLSTLVIIKTGMPSELNPFLLPFATTITAYITTQSLMTDLKVLLINRFILRVAYISMYLISIYNIATNQFFSQNMLALVIFTIALVIIFIFVPIGASDVRALAVALPYTISIGGYLGIQMLIFTLFVVAFFMYLHRRKKINKELKVFKVNHKDMYEEMGEKAFNRAARKTIKHQFDTSEEHAVPVGPFMIMPFLVFLIIYPIIIM